MNRAVIVHNPAARNAPRRERLYEAAGVLQPQGWEVSLALTEGAGHASVLAREGAAAGADVVFASGGDGTVNEVLNGLVGSESALGILRGGTGNVFAKEVKIPRSIEAALRLLVGGERRRFDLGVANGRHFILMAGIGFDGAVVSKVPTGPKRLLGTTSYVLWGAAEALRFRSRQATLLVDGERRACELYWLLLGNTRSYGGVVNVTGRALADDGLLDAYVFAGHGLGWVVATGLRIIGRRLDGAPGVSYLRAREVVVESPGFRVQADGEDFGPTPMTFAVAPGALSVLLPPGGAGPLLSRP